MKNFITTIGICICVLGMSDCKSKSSAYLTVKANTEKNITGAKWILYELEGVDLAASKNNLTPEAFIMFDANENRVNGNSGCNIFGGTYQIGPDEAIKFSGMVSTRKACLDMTVENRMNKMFQTIDGYSLQGDTLSLNQGKITLARFVKE